jgi:putative addiction module component (TIGR02574 family)
VAPDAQKLLQAALSLPEDVRVELAEALLESLDHEPSDDDTHAAWSSEAKRRLEEVRSGDVTAVPWEEAERRIFDPEDGATGR